MSDRDRSPHPDSAPDADTNRRSDIERAVDTTTGDVTRDGTDIGATSPIEPVEPSGSARGSGGVVTNQDCDGQ